MKAQTNIILTILIIFCSCQRAKNKGKELIEKSKNEIADVSKKTWKKSVNFVFNSFSSTENVTLKDIYSDEIIPGMDEMKSVQINFPPNFYSCYFKYKTDKAGIIKFLSELKTKQPEISDAEIKKSDGNELKKNLEFIEREMPDFKKEISFFYNIENIEKIEFYRCNKYPNANYLAIDVDKGIIYHLIEKYWN
ncbi:hypothetical protein SAMN04488096_1271 [Mesonia phycicola]|uniref:Lipoprotein n=1 Tax=Mesonia phycicola TaxID=579105 RepID=A0A1M6HWP1_9FLAO|nr:hypothetical protein [Mesonia phycicola]SHJ26656.1 hypothetical protein SAMN04488096_1271 [Mesonia phycicola]